MAVIDCRSASGYQTTGCTTTSQLWMSASAVMVTLVWSVLDSSRLPFGEEPACGVPWPSSEVALNVNTVELGNLGLKHAEEEAIVAFLQTLTDGYKSVKEGRPQVRQRLNLACDLLSAGLRVRTFSICVHSLVDVATWFHVRQHSYVYQLSV